MENSHVGIEISVRNAKRLLVKCFRKHCFLKELFFFHSQHHHHAHSTFVDNTNLVTLCVRGVGEKNQLINKEDPSRRTWPLSVVVNILKTVTLYRLETVARGPWCLGTENVPGMALLFFVTFELLTFKPIKESLWRPHNLLVGGGHCVSRSVHSAALLNVHFFTIDWNSTVAPQ